ncbi:MAG: SMP-30/gluconolactonase/LRE family protein, partial [Woeseia sp.]
DDPDLASLADDPRFQELVARTAVNTRPVSNSRHNFTLSRLDLLPEGIAWDPAGKRFFLGSMRSGEIFTTDSNGQHTLFATVAKDGPLSAIGMTVDTARNLLWVIGTGTNLLEDFASDAPVISGVFAFALDSGELQNAYTRDDVGFGFNDVTLAPNGDVYLSGAVLGFVPATGGDLTILETSEPVFGSNGIVVTPDGKTLITSSYPAGVAVIRISDAQTTFLQAPEDVPLYGIDGLYLYKGDLIAVQHGARPWRLMRYSLNDTLSQITAARTIEFANKKVTATTGAIVGNEIHYIGQGSVPKSMPAHLPEHLHALIGATIVMTAPLD